MSVLKKLAGETIIYGIGSILPRAMNFLFVASYLTFTMDSERYGIHGIMYAFVTVAMVLFTMRMETTYFKYASQFSEKKQAVFNHTMSIVLLTSTLYLLLMILNRTSLASWLTRPEDGRFILYFGLILFFDAMAAIPFASLRLASRPIKFATIKVLNSLITVLLVLFCFEILPTYFPNWYNNSYILDYAFISNLIASIVVNILLFKEIQAFRFSFDAERWKNLLQYAWPLILVGVAQAINQFSDRFFISYLQAGNLENEQNFSDSGLYTGAIKIASLMTLFVAAFNYAAEPFFFKNASSKDRKTTYGPIALAYTITACMLFLLISVNLDIVQFMIGKEYRSVVYVVPVALLGFLILGLYYNVSIWYKLSGQTRYGALIAIVGTLVFIPSIVILVPLLGLIGANIAGILCFSSMTYLAYYIGKKVYPIAYPVRKILFYLGLSIIFFLIFSLFHQTSTWTKTIVGNGLFIAYTWIAYKLDYNKLVNL